MWSIKNCHKLQVMCKLGNCFGRKNCLVKLKHTLSQQVQSLIICPEEYPCTLEKMNKNVHCSY